MIRVKKTATTAQPRQPPTSRPAAKRQHTRAPPSTTSVGVWREKLCQERSGWSRRGWGAGSSHPQRQQQHSQKPCAKKVIEPLLAPPLHIALPLTPPPLRHPPKQLVPPPPLPAPILMLKQRARMQASYQAATQHTTCEPTPKAQTQNHVPSQIPKTDWPPNPFSSPHRHARQEHPPPLPTQQAASN